MQWITYYIQNSHEATLFKILQHTTILIDNERFDTFEHIIKKAYRSYTKKDV